MHRDLQAGQGLLAQLFQFVSTRCACAGRVALAYLRGFLFEVGGLLIEAVMQRVGRLIFFSCKVSTGSWSWILNTCRSSSLRLANRCKPPPVPGQYKQQAVGDAASSGASGDDEGAVERLGRDVAVVSGHRQRQAGDGDGRHRDRPQRCIQHGLEHDEFITVELLEGQLNFGLGAQTSLVRLIERGELAVDGRKVEDS